MIDYLCRSKWKRRPACAWSRCVDVVNEWHDLRSTAPSICERGPKLEAYVVGSSETASGETHAFLWDGSTMRDIGTLGGNESFAVWINNVGQVTGYSRNASNVWRAFLFTPCGP